MSEFTLSFLTEKYVTKFSVFYVPFPLLLTYPPTSLNRDSRTRYWHRPLPRSYHRWGCSVNLLAHRQVGKEGLLQQLTKNPLQLVQSSRKMLGDNQGWASKNSSIRYWEDDSRRLLKKRNWISSVGKTVEVGGAVLSLHY